MGWRYMDTNPVALALILTMTLLLGTIKPIHSLSIWSRTTSNAIIPAISTASANTLRKTTSSFLRPMRFKYAQVKPRNLSTSSSYKRTLPTMMPEGPEVRTLVDQLQAGIGQRLVNLKFVSGRYTRHGKPKGFEAFRKTMTSYEINSDKDIDTVTDWQCKGKFIYLTLDHGMNHHRSDDDDFLRSIWITLGMSGRFARDAFQLENDNGTSHNQPRWYFEFLNEKNPSNNGTTTTRATTKTTTEVATRKIYYYDTRNFGTLRFSLSKAELEDKIDSLGPDILNPQDCTEEVFLGLFRKHRQSMNICKFLMDQAKISGVGNYILAEGLYKAKVDPFASLHEIGDDHAKDLYRALVHTATGSYQSQGMTRKGGSYRDVDGNKGQFSFSLLCYGQDVTVDGEPVLRETNGPHGRTIWYVESQLFMPRSERDLPFSDPSVPSDKSQANQDSPTSTSPSPLTPSSLLDSLHDESWKNALSKFLSSEKFERLSRFVQSERSVATVYPPDDETFNALNKCSFDDVKVVIIGQDPYHGPGQGHGLAFSVRKGVKPPPSLVNIFKELVEDEGIQYPSHGNLESWSDQGVLLLNTVLTVRKGEANSHSRMGWEDFTDEIVQVLNDEKDGLVFLLWGAPAAKKGKNIDRTKHTVIETSHPSPLGATKTKSPFIGSKCFSRCNDALLSHGHDAIDWSIPP